MRYILLALALVVLVSDGQGQPLVSRREEIEKAKEALTEAINKFGACLVKSDVNTCIAGLEKKAANIYQKYLIGGLLYDIDTATSFRLHQEAYSANPREQNFTLEYAIGLHRSLKYAAAIPLYESYLKAVPDDARVFTWLADCYINDGKIDLAIDSWKKANHPKNHTAIDFAIATIYGKTTQFETRSYYRHEIEKGNKQLLYALIFLDMNWERDWWNSNIEEEFLAEDTGLLESKLMKDGEDYKTLLAYTRIKKLSGSPTAADSIRTMLQENKLIVNGNPLPADGQIASDLLRICFINKLLSETDFYNGRGQELLELAQRTNDKELLNVYAYLQAVVKGQVDPAIDKLGWTKFKDERFAISYFLGKGDKNSSGDKELLQALEDFPQSSKLYWVKTNCAKMENKPLKPLLTELIIKEFRTLGSDENRFSDQLNVFFDYLAQEK